MISNITRYDSWKEKHAYSMEITFNVKHYNILIIAPWSSSSIPSTGWKPPSVRSYNLILLAPISSEVRCKKMLSHSKSMNRIIVLSHLKQVAIRNTSEFFSAFDARKWTSPNGIELTFHVSYCSNFVPFLIPRPCRKMCNMST